MKILQVGKFYHPYKGGMETVVKSLCEGLAEQGHDVTVLCSNTKFKFERETINGVKVLRSPSLGVLFSQPLCLLMPLFLLRYAKKYDTVQIHSPNPLIEFAMVFIRHLNLFSMHHSDVVRQKFLKTFYSPIYKMFLKKVKAIFVPTQNHIEYSDSVKAFENKCELVPFFIDESRLPLNEEVEQSIQDLKQKHGRFGLFVGRLVGYKGIDVLIRAAKDVDHKVIVIGQGPLKDSLEEEIKKHHLENKVILMGRIDSSTEFAAYYYACHYVVLPSVTPNENFGMIQLEGMFCEKPIITTNLKSGVPAVGIPGETTLLVEPGDSDGLASQMTQLINDEVLAKRLGKSGKKLYLKKYQKKTVVRKTLQAYGVEPNKPNKTKIAV
jgi:glycosyltransferase involved in cell wall biosynthesis